MQQRRSDEAVEKSSFPAPARCSSARGARGCTPTRYSGRQRGVSGVWSRVSVHPARATHSARRRRAEAAHDVHNGAAWSLRGCRHLAAQKTAAPRHLCSCHSFCERCRRVHRTAALVSAATLVVRRWSELRSLNAGQRGAAAAAEATDKHVRHRAASNLQRISSCHRLSPVHHSASAAAHRAAQGMLRNAAPERATAARALTARATATRLQAAYQL